MPRRPRSNPRPCQSISGRCQSSASAARSFPKSTSQAPPWLSPRRLPRTTVVATSVVRTRSELVPEAHPVGPRPVDRQTLQGPAVAEEELGAFVPGVVQEHRRVPVLGLEPDPEVERVVLVLGID